MKITKSKLRQIIREEIQKIKQPKMSTRLKELINKGWVLSEDQETVKNPVTGREIKVSSALSYDPSHPAYKAAKNASGSDDTKSDTESAEKEEKWKDLYQKIYSYDNPYAIKDDDSVDELRDKAEELEDIDREISAEIKKQKEAGNAEKVKELQSLSLGISSQAMDIRNASYDEWRS